ncbi:MAG: prepilin-type N-terminal cleavage/methylation domain-containing protein, partial [Thermoleophilia bacterium]
MIRCGSSGHTLLEVLVALLVVGIATAVPAVSLSRVLAGLEADVAARLWQSGAVAAQTHSVWGAQPTAVVASGRGLELTTGSSAYSAGVACVNPQVPGTNVSRWRDEEAVSVRFLPGFGSPDGAGSLYLGWEGNGRRVILRL